MSRAELPHTITSHPSLTLSLSLPADDNSGDAVFLAGGDLEGVLQLQCSGGIGLSRIEVELVGREGECMDVTDTRPGQGMEWFSERFASWRCHSKVPVSRPRMPVRTSRTANLLFESISLRDEGESSSLNFGRLRSDRIRTRRKTSFPISIPLPTPLPTSFTSPHASIVYSLHATAHLVDEHRKAVLVASRAVTVLQPAGGMAGELADERVAVEEVRLGTMQGGGRVRVEARSAGLGSWAVEGGRGSVGVAISNATAYETGEPRLHLIQVVRVRASATGQESEVQHLVHQAVFRGPTHITAPASESVFYLDFPLSQGLRSVSRMPTTDQAGQAGQADQAIDVHFVVAVTVPICIEPPQQVVVQLHIHIFHPTALPPDMWLVAHSFLAESRHRESAANQYRTRPPDVPPRSLRRWSAPLQTVKDLLSPVFRQPQNSPAPQWQGWGGSPSPSSDFPDQFEQFPSYLSDRQTTGSPQRSSISGLPSRSPSSHPYSPYFVAHPSSHFTDASYTSPNGHARAHPPPSFPPPRAHSYAQPEWVVHLSSIAEDIPLESKAERTSRHLRETSAGRGRSVSPPRTANEIHEIPHPHPQAADPVSPEAAIFAPLVFRREAAVRRVLSPVLHRPPSVTGPRPPPRRSLSGPIPPAPTVTRPALSRATTDNLPVAVRLPQVQDTLSPPILSPKPMPLADPPTANDEHEVATPVDPSSASLKRLSPATIKSLEALAALEISPVQDRSSTEPISTKSAARSSYIVTTPVPGPYGSGGASPDSVEVESPRIDKTLPHLPHPSRAEVVKLDTAPPTRSVIGMFVHSPSIASPDDEGARTLRGAERRVTSVRRHDRVASEAAAVESGDEHGEVEVAAKSPARTSMANAPRGTQDTHKPTGTSKPMARAPSARIRDAARRLSAGAIQPPARESESAKELRDLQAVARARVQVWLRNHGEAPRKKVVMGAVSPRVPGTGIPRVEHNPVRTRWTGNPTRVSAVEAGEAGRKIESRVDSATHEIRPSVIDRMMKNQPGASALPTIVRNPDPFAASALANSKPTSAGSPKDAPSRSPRHPRPRTNFIKDTDDLNSADHKPLNPRPEPGAPRIQLDDDPATLRSFGSPVNLPPGVVIDSDPHRSARGGRGGVVTSIRDRWAGIIVPKSYKPDRKGDRKGSEDIEHQHHKQPQHQFQHQQSQTQPQTQQPVSVQRTDRTDAKRAKRHSMPVPVRQPMISPAEVQLGKTKQAMVESAASLARPKQTQTHGMMRDLGQRRFDRESKSDNDGIVKGKKEGTKRGADGISLGRLRGLVEQYERQSTRAT